VVVTISGFANITDLALGRSTFGFDCGPGNLLMDAWIQSRQGRNFDTDGAWAASGEVVEYLLAKCLNHPFLHKTPPKTCGRQEFNLPWLESQLHGTESAVDIQSTMLEFTARAIALAVTQWCGQPHELIPCGGGVRNKTLMARLAELLPKTRITPSDDLGIAAEHVDATAFAWLARQTLRCATTPSAKSPRVVGAIYQA
jgi:anhydro-N-acetylmuramic acid kinase